MTDADVCGHRPTGYFLWTHRLTCGWGHANDEKEQGLWICPERERERETFSGVSSREFRVAPERGFAIYFVFMTKSSIKLPETQVQSSIKVKIEARRGKPRPYNLKER
jgi:hypothetical protein